MSGGVQTEYGSAFVVLLAVVFAGVSGAITLVIARRQRSLRKRDVVRPMVWAFVIAWAASLYVLLSHPRSLRGGHPVVGSIILASMLFAPFAGYWSVYHLMDRENRNQDSVA